MSRCFPFPKHAYVAKIVANDALINSIKLHGEAENADKAERKKQRKMEKTLRRQRKSEKKEHKTLNQLGKRKRNDEKLHNLGLGKDANSTKSDFDNLERSNITEELGKPSSYQNPCTSDSSENSIRRKRSVPLESGIQANGSVLKIRLAPQKSNDPDELFDQLTSLNIVPAAAPSIPSEQKCSTSGRRSKSRRTEAIDHGSTSLDKEMQLVSLLYKDLFSDFAPLHESSSWISEADDSWLFARRDSRKSSERCKPNSDMHFSSSSSYFWPKATYLPEVELYALPYTVPF